MPGFPVCVCGGGPRFPRGGPRRPAALRCGSGMEGGGWTGSPREGAAVPGAGRWGAVRCCRADLGNEAFPGRRRLSAHRQRGGGVGISAGRHLLSAREGFVFVKLCSDGGIPLEIVCLSDTLLCPNSPGKSAHTSETD